MAVTAIGSILVNSAVRTFTPFSIVPLETGVGYIHIINTNPPSLIPEFLYYIIQPYGRLNGTIYEIGRSLEWYPSGNRKSFVVPVYQVPGGTVDIGIAVKPIEIYPNRASPDEVEIELSYENEFTQPIAFGI